MWYLINSCKLLSENPQPPQKKSTPSPIKDSTSASPPFLPPLNIFQAPMQKWGGGGGGGKDTVDTLIKPLHFFQ